MSANQQHPTPVRMPPDLKNWIKEVAKANDRSMNAEIVILLTAARQQREQAIASA